MNTKNPGLALLEKKVDQLNLRREVEEELAQILIKHKGREIKKEQGAYTGWASAAFGC